MYETFNTIQTATMRNIATASLDNVGLSVTLHLEHVSEHLKSNLKDLFSTTFSYTLQIYDPVGL